MATRDPRVDGYIEKAQPFARPILKHLRKLVHTGCPEIEETIKWGVPAFTREGLVCFMAAFKEHCTFGFWKASLLGASKPQGKNEADARAMGQFGRITSAADLPADRRIVAMVKKACALNEAGVKLPGRTRADVSKRTIQVPDDFRAALRKNRVAAAAFDAFSYSHRKEYVDWVNEAKREETRARRIATSVEWLAEGKSHSWRYEEKPKAAKPAAGTRERRARRARP